MDIFTPTEIRLLFLKAKSRSKKATVNFCNFIIYVTKRWQYSIWFSLESHFLEVCFQMYTASNLLLKQILSNITIITYSKR